METSTPDTEAPNPASSNLPRNVRVLGVVSLVNDVASEMVFPLLPNFLLVFLGGNKIWLGLIEGLADTTGSLLKLVAGGWSDRAGKRKGFVLFGYSLAVFARPLIGILTAPWQLLLVRFSDRIGKGVRTAPRDALIADSVPAGQRGRAFGFHQAMDHLGAALGPLLAFAFLWAWPDSLRTLFLWTIVPGIIVLVLLLFGLREPPAKEPAKEPMQWTLKPFSRGFRWLLLSLVVFTLGNSSDAFLLIRAQELGVEIHWLPILWCVYHLAKSGGNWLLGRAVDRFGARRFILGGWFVYAGLYLAFGLATQAWHAWAFFLAYAIFYSLTEPAEKTLIASLAGKERKGLAFGWYNAAIGIAALPSSILFGTIYQQWGAFAAFAWGASLGLIAAAILACIPMHPPTD
ncbi:MAG: MFS transporter [Gemmataceae bacterium]|nr:MFS transporter [Gemmataceae bacterium]